MRFIIGAYGWQHKKWESEFYPEDLPQDWRFSYYVNEFDTVLVPSNYWLLSERPDIEGWLDDLPEDFKLFFEAGLNTQDQSVNIMLLEERQLSPFVTFSPIQNIHISSTLYSVQESVIPKSKRSIESHVLLKISTCIAINARQIRQVIEKFQVDYSRYESVYLFFDQALIEMNVIKSAKVIVELMAPNK